MKQVVLMCLLLIPMLVMGWQDSAQDTDAEAPATETQCPPETSESEDEEGNDEPLDEDCPAPVVDEEPLIEDEESGDQERVENASDEDFRPGEEISEDFPVPLPSDI